MMEMRWWTFRVMALHRKLTSLKEQKEEMFSYVAYPKPLEMRMAVVQSSGRSGDEVLDYIVRAEEIDAEIVKAGEELEGLHEYLDLFLPRLTERERSVMRLRFYDFEGWPSIAKAIYGEISEKNIDKARRVKKNAVKKLDTFLTKLDT